MWLTITHIILPMRRLALSIIHNLQLALGVVDCWGLSLTILIDRLIFKSSTSATKSNILTCVDCLLVDSNGARIVSFFITYSPDIGLISNFTFIIEMRVTFHVL